MIKRKNKKNIVGVIPARGGSKGLPGKNIAILAGKPVLAYTIEAALKSKVLDRVILTTNDKKIADIGKRYGAEVPFIRPAYLAKDATHTPPVIEHAVRFLEKDGYKVDIVVTLQPTSPLRKPEHIREAVKKIMETNADSVISVCESYPPWWLMRFKGEKLVPFLKHDKDYLILEKQQLPFKAYKINGAVYVTKRDVLRKKGVIIAKNCNAVVMNEESSLDIDTAIDLKIIKTIIKERKKNK